MNRTLLQQRAKRLRAELHRAAATSADATLLLAELGDLLDKADAGEIEHELEWDDVPGSMMFLEGSLHDDFALHDAFAEFQLLVTGMDG